MNKRVLLTGVAGGVGIHVLGHIMHNTDWHIIALDSFRHKGYKDRLEVTFSVHPDWRDRVTVIQHDLNARINLDERVDYILHLAAMSDVFYSVENPEYVIKNNIESTLNILNYARRCNPEAFVYFSTDEVYGPVKRGEAHIEWDTHRPSNAYAASKAACEDICYSYWRSYGLPLVITNTMNNFGEMQSGSKFPVMVQKWIQEDEPVVIHGNENEIGTRFYIHSRNAADALLYILNKPVTKHKMGQLDEPDRYHIVGSAHLSNMELAHTIARLMNKDDYKYRFVDFHRDNPGHDIHYGLQDNKLRPSGWSEPISFEDGLAETIRWQQEHPEWMQ